MTPVAVEARGLRKRFDTVEALAGVDLGIKEGEIFGIVGPDGAGKTTTIRLLCGLLDADDGEARVAGVDVRADPEAVKRKIGYMPQRFSLYGDLTVGENITFFANLFHVPAADRIAREAALLQAARMTPFRDRLAMNLSGGMKQKLSLACTLIHRPRVLFLDEPTTGVDPVSRRDFWKILTGLLGEGVTLVICTPSMDEAERCHRLAFFDRGRVLCCDTPKALRTLVKGDLFEVTVAGQRQAAKILSGVPSVTNVQVFGDRLHVLTSDAAAGEAVIRSRLEAAGMPLLGMRRIVPGLEDVFISLVGNGNDTTGSAGKAAEVRS